MSARRRRLDELEWTLRGQVFVVVAFFAFLGLVYVLVASGVAADVGQWIGRLWAELPSHTPAAR